MKLLPDLERKYPTHPFFTPTTYAETTVIIKDSTYTYDGNGNMTSDGEKVYEYDALNRLIFVHNLE